MFSYYGNNYTVRVAGRSTRTVDCSQCGCRFEYPVEIVGTGTTSSPYYDFAKEAERRATEFAEEDLARRLDTEVVPMPCPECGDYQPNMVTWMRRKHAKFPFPLRLWMVLLYLLITILVVVVIVGMAQTPQFTTTPLVYGFFLLIPWGLFSFLFVPVFLIQGLRRALYNPNTKYGVADRLALARSWARVVSPTSLD